MPDAVSVGVSVGLLNVMLNLSLFFTVAVADYLITQVSSNFALACLTSPTGRAPIVHDSDHFLRNVPRSIVKYRKNPLLLAAVLASTFLIVTEFVTELGVDVSETCGTRVVFSERTICPGDATIQSTPIETAASAFLLQSMPFRDGNFTQLTAHVRKDIDGSECFSCMVGEQYPAIASGCQIYPRQDVAAGEMAVSVKRTDGPFGTIAVSFRELLGSKVNHTGLGDVCNNGPSTVMFIIANETVMEDRSLVSNVVVYEYANLDHVNELLRMSRTTLGTLLEQKTKGPVQVYRIGCKVNELSEENFMESLMLYRTMQLEGVTRLVPQVGPHVTRMTEDDVYKGILARKLIDNDFCESDNVLYTTCGKYELKYLAPLVSCLILILGLRAWSAVTSRGKNIHIPRNSSSWFSRARALERGCGMGDERADLRTARGARDEMVLFQREDGTHGISIRERQVHTRSQTSSTPALSSNV